VPNVILKVLFGIVALMLVASLWLFLRVRKGSADRHFTKIQVLLWSGMLFANMPGALGLELSGAAVASFVVGGILLLASFVQIRQTKRLRQSWLAPQPQRQPPNEIT
jgi:hypothetical protein